jgi:hypothetical protein
MTLLTNKYSISPHSNASRSQKTMVIDLAEGERDMTSQKNLWDYIMIELNNMSSRKKKLYYHLSEENSLLEIVKNNLVHGCTYIVNSLSTNIEHF